MVLWPPKSPTTIFAPSNLRITGWTAVFKQDYSEVFKVPLQNRNQLLYIFVITFIFTLIATFVLSRQIIRPLSKLKDAMAAMISQKSFATGVQIKTRDEIEDLGNSFNYMATNLQEAFQKLEYDRQLLESERNKLQLAVSNIDDAIAVVDMNRKIVFANKIFLDITGWGETEVLGKPISDIVSIFEKNNSISEAKYCPVADGVHVGIVYRGNELRLSGKNDKESYVNISVGHVTDGAKVNIGAVIAFHDVTKDKELEEMKLDFVSMAAHELRTPLTSVRGYLSVLLDELRRKITPEQYSFLDKAFISSTQLAALVENLLSVARIEKQALQIQAQPTPWEPIVEETYSNFLPQAKERKVKLTYTKPTKKLPLVLVDKFRIGEVISNLVGNALNYTASGGSVDISLEVTADEVITHVKDTGQGIPQAAIPKLFTKFFRVSGVLEQGSKGTGLGLYISKAIIDMHKGKIWVDSVVGKGSNFSFTVPRAVDKKVKAVTPGKAFFLKRKKV